MLCSVDAFILETFSHCCFKEGMIIGYIIFFLDDTCSRINSLNVLIYGKMAEDCAKLIRNGVKYIHFFLCYGLFSGDVFILSSYSYYQH